MSTVGALATVAIVEQQPTAAVCCVLSPYLTALLPC